MRITAVDTVVYDSEPGPTFRWRSGIPGSEPPQPHAWLVITTDDGLQGLAHTPRGIVLQDMVERRIRDELVGADALRREWLWHRIWELDRIEEFPIYIPSLVDTALWDIAGKAAGMPVHVLAGPFRDRLPAYASTVTYASIEEYLDVADQCLELGYPAIKLHAWGDARSDARLCAALRAHLGDDVPLMYDGSAGFDLIDAIYVGDALADSGFLWYEEPMREFSITAYRWLADRIRLPLLVAETSDGVHLNAGDFVASGCASAIRTSVHYKGGFTGALRIAHLADAYLLRAEVHGAGLPNLHLCMSIPNTTYYETLVHSNPVLRVPEVDAEGFVHAPTAPGVGWEAKWERAGVPAELKSVVRSQ